MFTEFKEQLSELVGNQTFETGSWFSPIGMVLKNVHSYAHTTSNVLLGTADLRRLDIKLNGTGTR
jgi:hypothetical protein